MKILILASNPRKDLNLDREIRDLKDVIEKSRNRQEFEVEDALAVRVGDLQDLLLRHRPQVVHFCGHGSGQQGLVFEGDDGGEQWVRAEALSDLFKLFSNHMECILLNACYSEEQANAIVNHINYVIGMNQEIRDDAAIAFAKGFYRALGYDCSIEQAYEFGKNAIQLEISGSSKMRSVATEEVVRKAEVVSAIEQTAIPEHLKPILKIKPTLISSSRANITAPDQPLFQEIFTAIQLEINQSLGRSTQVNQPQKTGIRERSNFKGFRLFVFVLAAILTSCVGFILISRWDEIFPLDQVIDITNIDSLKEAQALEQATIILMSQDKLTEDILEQAVNNWQKAIQFVKQVSPSNERHLEALQKLGEYENQLRYAQALKLGLRAAILSLRGWDNTFEEWNNIEQIWREALVKLEEIPPTDDLSYARARIKIEDYQTKLSKAIETKLLAPFREGVMKAEEAAQAVITAKSQDDWITVAALWGRAGELMQKVPSQSANYDKAQNRVKQYQLNRMYAQQKAAQLASGEL